MGLQLWEALERHCGRVSWSRDLCFLLKLITLVFQRVAGSLVTVSLLATVLLSICPRPAMLKTSLGLKQITASQGCGRRLREASFHPKMESPVTIETPVNQERCERGPNESDSVAEVEAPGRAISGIG